MIRKLLTRYQCWLFGCEIIHQEQYHRNDDLFTCINCGAEASYSDLVGDTRFNLLKEWCNYWMFRKWLPGKCCSCGHRYKCDETIDHIPF